MTFSFIGAKSRRFNVVSLNAVFSRVPVVKGRRATPRLRHRQTRVPVVAVSW
jgi:hypothetical protein